MKKISDFLGVDEGVVFTLESDEVVVTDKAIFKVVDNVILTYNESHEEWQPSLLALNIIAKCKIKKTILTDEEKKYLEFVLKPFKNEISSIKKIKMGLNEAYLRVYINDDDSMIFPTIKNDKYYKNMETNVEYTLDSLGLYKGV